jgi:hypothetical protein
MTPQVTSFAADGSVSECSPGSYYSVDLRLPEPPKVALAPGVIRAQSSRLALAIEAIRAVPGNETRPIVLVGHSRGGMVAREYLTSRAFAEKPAPISDVVFLSTPHEIYTKVCGNRPLPRNVQYHSLVNRPDRVVWLGEQMSIESQQPGISHSASCARTWDSRLMHELEGAPGEDIFSLIDSIASGRCPSAPLAPYASSSTSDGALGGVLRFVGDHAFKAGAIVGATVGAGIGSRFGGVGLAVGTVTGAFIGAITGVEASGHSLLGALAWKDSSCGSRPVATEGAPAAPSSNVAKETDRSASTGAVFQEYRLALENCRRALAGSDLAAAASARSTLVTAAKRLDDLRRAGFAGRP